MGRARRWLQRALESGNGDAAAELGRMHLEGDGVPASAGDALAWFRRGATAGSARAAHRLATMEFTALGTPVDREAAREHLLSAARGDCPEALRVLGFVYARLEPASEWESRAFACLQRAACLGDAPAAHACGVRLATGRGVSADPERGHAWLRRAAEQGMYVSDRSLGGDAADSVEGPHHEDPEAVSVVDFEWPAPREASTRRLAEDPPVHEVDGLLDPEMCDYLMNLAHPWMEPARTVDPNTGESVRNQIRTNSAAAFTGERMDIAVHLVEIDMCHLARGPVAAAERLALLRYDVGEEYRPHFDYINPHARDAQSEYQRRGQRVKTIFAYLNDVAGGGETEFPRLGVKISPRRGGGVLFRNVDRDGRPDSASLHAGCPVTEGEKWLATLWIRERAAPFR